jgi:hypothetical protein
MGVRHGRATVSGCHAGLLCVLVSHPRALGARGFFKRFNLSIDAYAVIVCPELAAFPPLLHRVYASVGPRVVISSPASSPSPFPPNNLLPNMASAGAPAKALADIPGLTRPLNWTPGEEEGGGLFPNALNPFDCQEGRIM